MIVFEKRYDKYVFKYENNTFYAYLEIDPDNPVIKEQAKIKNEKDFDVEIMWQYEKLMQVQQARFELSSDDLSDF